MSRLLGIAGGRPHNPGMEITSDQPEHGFQFPGAFEITAMGPASAGLEDEIPRLLEAAGLTVLHETVATRASSAGKFVSVRLSFHAQSRAEYDAAHEALRAHPEVKWTL
jgi:uncharacterized protein